MKPVIYHPEAGAEFDAAAERYESLSAGLGGSCIDEVEAIVARIEESPAQFPVWPVLESLMNRDKPTDLDAALATMSADGLRGIGDAPSRTLVLAAMKKAAESRVAGVTDQKARRHYEHAAELVATCVACDDSSATARWVAALQAEYRRFPALRAELDRAMGAS